MSDEDTRNEFNAAGSPDGGDSLPFGSHLLSMLEERRAAGPLTAADVKLLVQAGNVARTMQERADIDLYRSTYDEDDPEPYWTAYAKRDRSNGDLAGQLYEEALQLAPYNVEALRRYSNWARKNYKFDEALDATMKLIHLNGGEMTAELATRLGNIYEGIAIFIQQAGSELDPDTAAIALKEYQRRARGAFAKSVQLTRAELEQAKVAEDENAIRALRHSLRGRLESLARTEEASGGPTASDDWHRVSFSVDVAMREIGRGEAVMPPRTGTHSSLEFEAS